MSSLTTRPRSVARADSAFPLLPGPGTRRAFLASTGLGALGLAALAACGRSSPTTVKSADIRHVTDVKCVIGENPVWDVAQERLYWIDGRAGTIYRSTANGTELQQWQFPGGTLSSLALRAKGGAIVTAAAGIYLYDFDTEQAETVFQVEGQPGVGFNDAKVDRQGRLVTGLVDGAQLQTPAGSPELRPSAALYRVDSDLAVQTLLADGFVVSNGPCFSPDGTSLYWNDSWALRSYVFDYDTNSGQASNRRVLVDFTNADDGLQPLPDGATVDEEGFMWTAALYAGEVRRYTPDGALDRTVALPLAKPLGVAFGGPDLSTLYVTTMGPAGFPGDPLPAASSDGSLLAITGLGVRGVPEKRFAG